MLAGRVVDETIVSRRLNAAVTVRGVRTTGTVQVFDDRRSFQFTGGDDETLGVSANVSRRLSRTARATASGSWQQSSFANSPREDNRLTLSVSYSRPIVRGTSGHVTVSHVRNDSDEAAREFREMRVTAGVNVVF